LRFEKVPRRKRGIFFGQGKNNPLHGRGKYFLMCERETLRGGVPCPARIFPDGAIRASEWIFSWLLCFEIYYNEKAKFFCIFLSIFFPCFLQKFSTIKKIIFSQKFLRKNYYTI